MSTIFRRATFDEELLTFQRWRHLWGDGLSPSCLVERESILRSKSWGKNVEVYCIADTITNELYSTCDVYTIHAILNGANVEFLHVASLFTPEEHRKKGFASALIRGLIRIGERKSGVIGIILFSDIGASFYNSLGFKVVGDEDIPHDFVFPAVDLLSFETSTIPVELIKDVEELEEVYSNKVEYDVSDNNTAILPIEISRAKFHIHFDSFCPKAPKLDSKKTIFSAAKSGTDVIMFTADYNKNELEILAMSASNGDVAISLIGAAMKEAVSRGLDCVRLWSNKGNSCYKEKFKDFKGERVERKGRLPMMYQFSSDLAGLSNISRIHWW